MVPGQIMPIEKPPHLRSKAPLQQIQITEVPDLGIHVPHLSVPSEKDQVRSEESSTATKPMIEVIDVQNNSQVQVNLCQKLLCLHQLTHNMTTDCSFNYKFNT